MIDVEPAVNHESPRNISAVLDPFSTPVVTFATEVVGIALTEAQAEALAAYFDRPGGELLLRWGRQSGKTTILCLAVAYVASLPEAYRARLPHGTIHALLIANSLDQAREAFGRIAGWFRDRPMLASRVVKSTEDTLTLRGDVVISCLPASARTVRGRSAAIVAIDEVAHALESEGPAAAKMLYRAIVPSLGRFGDLGRVVLASTPFLQTGLFHEHVERAERGDERITYRAGSTVDIYPGGITEDELDRLRETDPDLAREYAGEFWDSSASAFLEPVAIDNVTRAHRLWLAPRPNQSCLATIDPAFEARGDAFAMAVGWRSGENVIVAGVDAWRGQQRALDVDATLDAVAARCREYAVTHVVTDQGFSAPVVQGLERRGVSVMKKPLTSSLKWDITAGLRTAINTGTIELPPDPRLRRELVGLVMTLTPAGRPNVQATGRQHDDLAMAVATLVYELRTNWSTGRWSRIA